MGTVRDDMTLALRLAEKADALTLGRFGAMDLQVDTKPDLTPVTDADRSVSPRCGTRWPPSVPTILFSAKNSAAQRFSPAGSG